MEIKREDFLNEANQEKQLRKQVCRAVTIFFKKQRKILELMYWKIF